MALEDGAMLLFTALIACSLSAGVMHVLRPAMHTFMLGPFFPGLHPVLLHSSCKADVAGWCLCRVASNAAENEMDAHALALSLAPCVAWHAPPQSERRRVSHPRRHFCACLSIPCLVCVPASGMVLLYIHSACCVCSWCLRTACCRTPGAWS